jgi:hypothetical protein
LVTNGSKTAVMDVIGFLCLLLGSSTVQLHDSLSSGRASVQRLVSVVKMATVLEKYAAEEQRSVVLFCGQKDSMQRIIIKKCILPTVGSNCRVKRFHLDDESVADEEVETEVRKWLRQQSKDLYAACFDALVKRRGKCTNVCGGYISRNTFFFQNLTCFTFYIHL